MENFNSLGILSGNAKITAINNLCRDFKVDILCGCETQIDWRMVPQERRFHNLVGTGSETRSVVAHNINERILQNQFGGCAMMAMGSVSPEIIGSGVDTTGLGRWCWMRIGTGKKTTRVVIIYQPSNSGRSAGNTVKDQHSRYFRALGDARSPRTIFFEQLIAQLLIWKEVDNDIIIFGNLNKNIYSGRIARQLAQNDLNFIEICRKHTGRNIPPTFFRGSTPINGIFCNSRN